MMEGESFGRDCDSIASICGNLAGALRGASVIRPEWIETSEKANADMFEELHGEAKQNFRHMAARITSLR